jgi:hypothetical protein
MSPEQPIDDAGHCQFDLEREIAAVVGTISASDADDREREPSRALVRTIAQPAVEPDEIKIDETDRVSISALGREGFAIRAALGATVLVAALGSAWIVIGVIVAPSSLPLWGNRSASVSGSSQLPAPAPNPSASVPDSTRGDRIQAGAGAGAAASRGAGAAKPEPATKLSASAPESSRKRLVGAASASPTPATKRSPAVQPQLASIERRAVDAESPPKLVPVPETRPTTIEGWTVRDVVNGTAVLEGPNGVWRAAAGSTVPPLGRVDSIVRWGNRWIVATSSGLITTP